MKASRIYITGILLFLVIMFAVEYSLPKKFVWRPTFSRYDKQPFGCAVFDDMVAASVTSGYSITDKTIYQLEQDSISNTGVLVVAQWLSLVETDMNAMLDMAARGNKLMVVSETFDQALADTLNFEWDYEYFGLSTLRKQVLSGLYRDTIRWEKDSLYDTRYFTAYPHLCESYFFVRDSVPTALAVKSEQYTSYTYNEEADSSEVDYYFYPELAIRRKVGAGEIILVSTPLLFTNYGMLDGDNSDFIFRLLSQMRGMPLVRTEAYTGIDYDGQSPFRYFISQRPLRWALYMAVAIIVLFMIFTARRTQRAIPVVSEPENKSVEFTELIATLYYQKKDHADLVRKKYLYFTETLRRKKREDVEEQKIQELLADIESVMDSGVQLTEEQMKNYIDRINEITNHL